MVGVTPDKCYVLWPKIMKAYGDVKVIKKGAVNLFLIIKFIQYHYNLQRHLDLSLSHQLYWPRHLVITQIHQ